MFISLQKRLFEELWERIEDVNIHEKGLKTCTTHSKTVRQGN